MLKKFLLALLVIFFSAPMVFAHEGDLKHEVGDKPILFVRQGCQYCAKVDAFMEKNDLKDQVQRRETLNNNENIALLDEYLS